jgi:FlaG/FlaF family flagellin (archaellin)
MMRRLWMAAAAILAMTAAVALPAHADEWSKKYSISGRADLRVMTDDGDVTVSGTDQKEIDAHVVTDGYKISSSDVRINESQSGDHVTIEVKLPHMNWHIFGSPHRSVRIDVRVPRDLDLTVHTGDGNVSAAEFSGHIEVDTGDGNINANNLKGQLRLKSGDGHIDAANLDGSLDVNTGDGRVNVSGRFDSLGVNTGDGSIEARVLNGSKVAGNWRMHSGDGHINVWLPGDLSADIEAHTGDGKITMDIPVMVSGSLSHSSVHGKLNGGGGTLSVTTGDGSIHLQKL